MLTRPVRFFSNKGSWEFQCSYIQWPKHVFKWCMFQKQNINQKQPNHGVPAATQGNNKISKWQKRACPASVTCGGPFDGVPRFKHPYLEANNLETFPIGVNHRKYLVPKFQILKVTKWFRAAVAAKQRGRWNLTKRCWWRWRPATWGKIHGDIWYHMTHNMAFNFAKKMLYYVAHGSIERYEDSMWILWGYIPNIWKCGR